MWWPGAVLFLGVYATSLVARRIEDCLDAGDELLWRAQGSRRAFRLLDWDPTTT